MGYRLSPPFSEWRDICKYLAWILAFLYAFLTLVLLTNGLVIDAFRMPLAFAATYYTFGLAEWAVARLIARVFHRMVTLTLQHDSAPDDPEDETY